MLVLIPAEVGGSVLRIAVRRNGGSVDGTGECTNPIAIGKLRERRITHQARARRSVEWEDIILYMPNSSDYKTMELEERGKMKNVGGDGK